MDSPFVVSPSDDVSSASASVCLSASISLSGDSTVDSCAVASLALTSLASAELDWPEEVSCSSSALDFSSMEEEPLPLLGVSLFVSTVVEAAALATATSDFAESETGAAGSVLAAVDSSSSPSSSSSSSNSPLARRFLYLINQRAPKTIELTTAAPET